MRRLALGVVGICVSSLLACHCGQPPAGPVVGWGSIFVGQNYHQVELEVGEPCIILADYSEPRGRGPLWKYGCEVDGGFAHSVRLCDGVHVCQVDGAP